MYLVGKKGSMGSPVEQSIEEMVGRDKQYQPEL